MSRAIGCDILVPHWKPMNMKFGMYTLNGIQYLK